MDDNRIHDLRVAGWSLRKIANEVGCTASEVIASLSRQAAKKPAENRKNLR